MKANRISKKRNLPNNFQEVLIIHEMKFEKGDIDLDLIRKLIYIYSLGMEYYDSLNKPELYEFYFSKSKKLFINPTVLKFLEHDDISNTSDIKLFEDEQLEEKRVPAKKRRSISTDLNLEDFRSRKMKMKTFSNFNFNKNKNVENLIKTEVEHLDSKLNKLTTNVDKEIIDQKNSFEELKRKKLEEQHKGLNKSAKSKKYIKRNLSDDYKIIDDADTQMNKEIDDITNYNNEEMNKALNELKKSFDDEIIQLDETAHFDIINSLKEDMKYELENLKELYEEQKRTEINKIRAKYIK